MKLEKTVFNTSDEMFDWEQMEQEERRIALASNGICTFSNSVLSLLPYVWFAK